MSRLYSFLGQALLAFLPVLFIQLMALSNLLFAASLSQAFAVVGVVFSVLYMAQRQYVNIYGPIDMDVSLDIHFRLLNTLVAVIVSCAVLYNYALVIYVVFFAIAVKSSESLLDYAYGYLNYRHGFSSGASIFFRFSFGRFFLLASFLITFYLVLEVGVEFTSYVTGGVSILILFFSIVVFSQSAVLPSRQALFEGYIRRAKILLPFSVSASLCACLVVLPRWVVDVGNEKNNIFLVAFSLVPIFGVLFSTLFAAYIDLAKVNMKKSFAKLLVIVGVINLVFYFLEEPLSAPVIQFVLGYQREAAMIFVKAINMGVLFFSAILFANYYKFTRPYYEGGVYISGALALLLARVLGLDIYQSIAAASLLIFLLSVFSLRLKNEKSLVFKNIE